jgi:hypothetical protein
MLHGEGRLERSLSLASFPVRHRRSKGDSKVHDIRAYFGRRKFTDDDKLPRAIPVFLSLRDFFLPSAQVVDLASFVQGAEYSEYSNSTPNLYATPQVTARILGHISPELIARDLRVLLKYR